MMNKRYLIVLFLVAVIQAFAQSNIRGYEYWFNDNYAGKTKTTVASSPSLIINQNVPTNGLPHGINSINVRSYDNAGVYSSILTHYFYKASATETANNPKTVAYQYWLDDQYAQAVTVNTPLQEVLNLNQLLSMGTLSHGIHRLNIRFKNNTGLWSSTLTHYFYKSSATESNANPKTVAYQYWLDDNYAQTVTVNTPMQEIVNISDLL